MKQRLRNLCRNSILMTQHCPHLDSASYWLKICFIQSEAFNKFQLQKYNRIWHCLTRKSPQVNNIIMRLFYHPDLGSDASSAWNFCSHFSGLEIKKSSGRLLATNWRNIITRCKFLVASLYNVNDAAHSLVRSIRFDWLKISRTEVGLNWEVNWLCVCNLAHFL